MAQNKDKVENDELENCKEVGSIETSHGAHGSSHHSRWMVLACIVPLILLGVMYWWNGGSSSVFSLFFLLLCPVIHIIMMFWNDGSEGEKKKGCH